MTATVIHTVIHMARSLTGLSAIAGIALLATACTPPGAALTVTGATMGTSYSVQLIDPSVALRDPAHLNRRLAARLRHINAVLSTYDRASDISRVNAAQHTRWIPVSPLLVARVRDAEYYAELSQGAFDISIGPLVNLWGFGPQRPRHTVPSAAAVAAAKALVGRQRIETRTRPPALRKLHRGVRIDLSAIAKGYAVDALAHLLDEHGADNYLVEIGGELRVKGVNATGSAWRIGIERPNATTRQAQHILRLSNQAMATSGDYRNYFITDGQRYAHTINPATGYPVKHHLASVSVIADHCAQADALATALMAMGPHRAKALAERKHIAALFIERTAQGFATTASTAFNNTFPDTPFPTTPR